TRFVSLEGEPVQLIDEPPKVPLQVVELKAASNEHDEADIERFFGEEAGRPFDLSNDLMLRVTLGRLGGTDHVLILTLHHIAADGWSMGVLFRELAALYEAFIEGRAPNLPELPIQYADFAVWQRERMEGEVLQKQLAYWKGQLAGAPDFLELPADRPRPPVQTFRGRWHRTTFPKPLRDAVKGLSQREGA